jgi:hypothetical protein
MVDASFASLIFLFTLGGLQVSEGATSLRTLQMADLMQHPPLNREMWSFGCYRQQDRENGSTHCMPTTQARTLRLKVILFGRVCTSFKVRGGVL